MSDSIEVNGVVWTPSWYTKLDEGSDAEIFESKEHPHLVLMIFPSRARYKYDWFDYLGLILGQSRWNNNYVIVLPRMEQVSGNQDWIDWMQFNYSGSSIEDWVPVEYKRNFDDPIRDKIPLMEFILSNQDKLNVSGKQYIIYWTEKILEFISLYPRYENDLLDFGKSNVMVYNGKYVLIDPIAGTRI